MQQIYPPANCPACGSILEWEKDQLFDPLDVYNEILESYANKYELTSDEVEEYMKRIAFHETDWTEDPSMHQYEGGPGRGLFQFEIGKGKGAEVAIQRFRNFYKDNNPTLSRINIPSDFSLVPEDMQKALFLINLMKVENREGQDVKANLASAKSKGTSGLEDLWINYHWAGWKEDPASEPSRRQDFQRSMLEYNRRYNK